MNFLLHAFGERDFNGKPVLAKWTHRILSILASTGLTLVDARPFFDVSSPIYQALTNPALNFVAQLFDANVADLARVENATVSHGIFRRRNRRR